MQKIADVPYAPDHGFRGLGDLYLPDRPARAPLALAIHGGGWNAMDKSSWAGVAEFLCEQGFLVYNINYRLLDDAPWPACGDDCLAAARFLLSASHDALARADRSSVVIMGGSAGGHLALMTGLRLPAEKCRAIVSVAGPTDLIDRIADGDRSRYRKFFATTEVTDRMLLAASPVNYVSGHAPPLFCVHSTNDQLVPIGHSQKMLRVYRELGRRAELYAYPGPGQQHGIWIDGSDPHRLLPDIEKAVSTFLKTV